MAHPNDTLNGRLLPYELDEEKHLRSKMGYWLMVEERMITEQMIAEGKDSKSQSFYFEVKRRVMENHKNDIPFSQQTVRRVENHTEAIPFTREELERLVEHFGMANDPIAQSIHNHAWAALVRMETREKKS